MRDADAALYRAKERGRGGYEIFDEAMRSRVIDHMQTENDLRRALQRGELELHYQPIVSLQRPLGGRSSRRCCAGATPSAA